MKRILFTVMAFILTFSCFSQTPGWEWAELISAPSTTVHHVNFLAKDGAGNIYVTGYFSNGGMHLGATTLNNAGGKDAFLVKYDQNGNMIWAKSFGSNSDEFLNSVTVDPSGDIYVVGYFSSSSLIIGSTTLTNSGMSDVLL